MLGIEGCILKNDLLDISLSNDEIGDNKKFIDIVPQRKDIKKQMGYLMTDS